MLKAATLVSMLVAAPAFAAADSAGLEASRAMASSLARTPDRSGAQRTPSTRVAEAAAWKTLVGGLMRSSGQVMLSPERSLAALATPDLAGEVAQSLKSR